MAVDPRDLLGGLHEAAARAAGSGHQSVLAAVAPARTDVDCAALFTQDEDVSMVWEQPDRDVHIVARGVTTAIESMSGGANGRLATAAAHLDSVFDAMTVVHLDRSPMEPLAMGGFSFAPLTDWRMGPGTLVVPELAYVRRDGRAAWIRAAAVSESDDLGEVASLVARDLSRVLDLGGGWLPPLPLPASQPFAPADAEYPKLVQRAVEEIGTANLAKLVVARRVELAGFVDVAAVLATLRDGYPGCATFAIGLDGSTLFGSTPELLVRARGGRIETAAVAGTAPRGPTYDEDDALGRALQNDPKERLEHRLVYEHIRLALAQCGVELDAPRQPEVLKLPGLQHLWTRVTGTIPGPRSLVRIVAALHPTPAVAGVPIDRAVDWLGAYEGLDRGWYTGPVGYVDRGRRR